MALGSISRDCVLVEVSLPREGTLNAKLNTAATAVAKSLQLCPALCYSS